MMLTAAACGKNPSTLTYDNIPESTGGKDVVRSAAADDVFSLNCNSKYSFNPIIATNHSNQLVCALVYENMLELDNDFNVIKNIIVDWDYSEDYKSWIFTIARNKSLNLLKKRSHEMSVDFSENDYLGSYETDIELSVTIKSALKILKPDERQIVLLRASGVKAKEIAQYLGMPRPTVSWKHKEALNKLKKFMEGAK